jgi:hypothetical protein
MCPSEIDAIAKVSRVFLFVCLFFFFMIDVVRILSLILRSIHAACDVLLYGTKGRKFFWYDQEKKMIDKSDEDEVPPDEATAVDDFCLWVVGGMDQTRVPIACGVPVKEVKKLKRFHEAYQTDFFK